MGASHSTMPEKMRKSRDSVTGSVLVTLDVVRCNHMELSLFALIFVLTISHTEHCEYVAEQGHVLMIDV